MTTVAADVIFYLLLICIKNNNNNTNMFFFIYIEIHPMQSSRAIVKRVTANEVCGMTEREDVRKKRL